MEITHDMSISEVQARMGNAATRLEAAAMADLLVESGHADTNEISDREWFRLCDQAIAAACNQKPSEWIAYATRRNVDGKADYLWILSYSNGVPVRYPSEAAALEAAARACADPAHALYGPRAVEQHN
jgi:hypothetical protein